MPKQTNPRAVKAARSYTVPEAADALDVTSGTVRQWIRNGLRVMKAQRPCLILGSDIREFLTAMRAGRRTPLGPDQLYCLSCRRPCQPYGMMVDYIAHSAHTGRLSGLCDVCDGTANRMVGRASLPALREIFDIHCRGGNEG